jgi:hypothetical protein
MNPTEEPYTTEPFQVNVYKVYLKIIQVLSKKNNQKKPGARILKERIGESYKIFCEEKGIDDDYNDYNRGRLGLIESTDGFWFTWFSYELVCLESALIYLHLNQHYKKAKNKKVFLATLHRSLNFISVSKLSCFESKLLKIVTWIDSKNSKTKEKIEIQSGDKKYSINLSETEIQEYFFQLSDKGHLTRDQIIQMIKANFISDKTNIKVQLPILGNLNKSHLNFFVYQFFKKYGLNNKNSAMHTSQFLRGNFKIYEEENKCLVKENNLRKNFKSTTPKKFEFKIL